MEKLNEMLKRKEEGNYLCTMKHHDPLTTIAGSQIEGLQKICVDKGCSKVLAAHLISGFVSKMIDTNLVNIYEFPFDEVETIFFTTDLKELEKVFLSHLGTIRIYEQKCKTK